MKKIVIKFGSSSLTNSTSKLSLPHMLEFVRQIWHLYQEGNEIIIVSSGAIASGREKFPSLPNQSVSSKQMLASIGQVSLMNTWSSLFAIYGITIAQVLLTRDDFSDSKRASNAKNTFLELTQNRVIPIVNENDTIATEEIRVGDNDNLSAFVAQLTQADLLILLTDQEGLFTKDPRSNPDATLISEIDTIDDTITACAQGTNPQGLGTGGMITKIQAAKVATQAGASTVIASSKKEHVLIDLVAGHKIGTLFTAKKS